MRVIANNLANVGTTAYKRDRANFATLAYQDTRVAGQQSSNETTYATGLNLGTGVGIGTDIDYFPLNNHRPAVDSADFIFCSIRPQAHAFDDATVIENLEGQTHLVASARQVFAPLPFVASPVTLKRRWHKGPPRPANELPPMVDRRQLSLLGAGWLVGSLRALAEAGAASVTWFETTGWRGAMWWT